jgi:two-component system sensor histidine kinase ChvG
MRFTPGRRLSLTPRLLIINLLPLLLLGGGVFYLDSYRKQLLNERYKLARVEAQITAEALAGASRERQEALLIQIGKEQKMRLRMFDAEGKLWADSFELAEPSFAFDQPGDETWQENLARWMDRAVDKIAGARPVPDYIEPEETIADAWPELRRARDENLTRIQLRDASDGTPVINTAAPVGLRGATLLTTRNAVDITQEVREARGTLITAVLLALAMSTLLSLYMARTIVRPLRMLASATNRVRQGRERQVEVPRLPGRRDEIGQLARAIADMTDTLRHRIDAVEHFAADVAHEIKNPLASLRSALESLGTVDDKDLRQQLNAIAAHDVRRIDRLVSEISEASRIDAELSRATFEQIDLAALAKNIVGRRETRAENAGRPVSISHEGRGATVMGVPVRLERVIDNLLDNAVSFSPPDSPIELNIDSSGGFVTLSVSDHGPGIPEEAREKVFRRFHSDRPEDEGFGQHSGLGLAIARTIAEAHDGTLIAESRPDGAQGASLVMTLPEARQRK